MSPPPERRCPNPDCGEGPEEHVRTYYLSGGRVVLRVRHEPVSGRADTDGQSGAAAGHGRRRRGSDVAGYTTGKQSQSEAGHTRHQSDSWSNTVESSGGGDRNIGLKRDVSSDSIEEDAAWAAGGSGASGGSAAGVAGTTEGGGGGDEGGRPTADEGELDEHEEVKFWHWSRCRLCGGGGGADSLCEHRFGGGESGGCGGGRGGGVGSLDEQNEQQVGGGGGGGIGGDGLGSAFGVGVGHGAEATGGNGGGGSGGGDSGSGDGTSRLYRCPAPVVRGRVPVGPGRYCSPRQSSNAL